jgi:hypothetical protein
VLRRHRRQSDAQPEQEQGPDAQPAAGKSAALTFARTFVNSIMFGALDEWLADPGAFVEETVDLLVSGLLP